MKKVSARKFQQYFGKSTNAQKPGESVEVTKLGKGSGICQRTPQLRVQQPNFLERVEDHAYPEKIGNQVLDSLRESFS